MPRTSPASGCAGLGRRSPCPTGRRPDRRSPSPRAEPPGGEGPRIDGRRTAGDQVADDPPGRGGGRQPDVLVPEGEEGVAPAGGLPADGQIVRPGRTAAPPARPGPAPPPRPDKSPD